MPAHSTAPNSSTTAQRKLLVSLGRQHGLDVDGVRDLAGGKLHDLSSSAADALIKRLSDRDLPLPEDAVPACRPRVAEGVTRMISPEQGEQIERLMAEYFKTSQDSFAWLKRMFKVDRVRDLATAKRASQVIVVLKGMINRRRIDAATRD